MLKAECGDVISNIKLFESMQIRSVWNKADSNWYFSVADVVRTLTGSANVRDYIKKMRKRVPELDANWGTICPLLELTAHDGKRRKTQCANAVWLLRIIQAIPLKGERLPVGRDSTGREKSGRRVSTKENFKSLPEAVKRKKIKKKED